MLLYPQGVHVWASALLLPSFENAIVKFDGPYTYKHLIHRGSVSVPLAYSMTKTTKNWLKLTETYYNWN